MSGQARRSGRLIDATLAALATLTAAWPVSTLLAQPTWLRGSLVVLTVIVLSGSAARWLNLRGWQVPTVQLICSILTASAFYGRDHLWYGLPTLDTLEHAGRLFQESVETAQKFAAPAPSTPGVIFVVGCSLGVAALAVDYLAVTCRSPSLAGLPLLTVFLAAVANKASTMPVIFFLAASAMWLILMARSGRTILRQWGTTSAMAHTPAAQGVEPHGVYEVYEHASIARALGALALIAAVAVPAVLPHPRALFLASGLGRSTAGAANGSQTLGFSQSLDLAADLKSGNTAPVLQYSTADPSPPPLRVAIGSSYRPEPGLWLPWGRPWVSGSGKPDLTANPTVRGPTGLSPDVPRRTFVAEVHRNLLQDPFLATPYPLVAADLGGVDWGADYQTQSVRVAQRPDSYTVSYLRLEPTVAMLRNAPPLTDRERLPLDLDLDLRLEEPYAERVNALTTEVTAGKSSVYDQAMAIQQYLRADGGFSYSLTLAPRASLSGRAAGADPLTHFLATKKGYCVQFATAMVMMSRAAGIPARMNLGFLPGTKSEGVWTVVAADAHAWPELFLDGIGWTRFEPTPTRGTTPGYATPSDAPGTAAGALPQGTATTAVPGENARKDIGDTAASGGAGLGANPFLRWLTRGWGAILLGTLMVLLGSAVVPSAALWRRRRSLTAARTTAGQVEARWEQLTSSLNDLGIAAAPSLTPRQLRGYYDREASLDGSASQALGRIVQTLERARYATAAPGAEGFDADARQVLDAAASTRAGRTRLRAVLWPGSGVAQLRSAGTRLAGRLQAPLRQASEVMNRRSARGAAQRSDRTPTDSLINR